MENYKDIINKINLIIEKSNNDKPKCKNCVSFCDDTCTFGCINERHSGKYLVSQRKLTAPNYFCENFKPIYDLNENTINILRDIIKNIERVNEDVINFELLFDGKINENEFVELVK